MIWAPGIKNQDITDYHIDSLARFTGAGRMIFQLIDDPDPSDPWQTVPYETHDTIADVANAVEAASIFRIPDPPPRTIRIRCMAAAGVRQP